MSTTITGTITDSGGVPLPCQMDILLNETLTVAAPAGAQLRLPVIYSEFLPDGVVDISLQESVTQGKTYTFEFYRVSTTTLLYQEDGTFYTGPWHLEGDNYFSGSVTTAGQVALFAESTENRELLESFTAYLEPGASRTIAELRGVSTKVSRYSNAFFREYVAGASNLTQLLLGLSTVRAELAALENRLAPLETGSTQSAVANRVETLETLVNDLTARLQAVEDGSGPTPDTIAPTIIAIGAPYPPAQVGVPYSLTLSVSDERGLNLATLIQSALTVKETVSDTNIPFALGATGSTTQQTLTVDFTTPIEGNIAIAVVEDAITDQAGNAVIAGVVASLVATTAAVAAPNLADLSNQTISIDGQAYSRVPVNNGGVATYTATGLYPNWVINSATGAVTGYAELEHAATTTIEITASNAAGDSVKSYTITREAIPIAGTPKVVRSGGQSNWSGSTDNGAYTGRTPIWARWFDPTSGTLKIMSVAEGFRDRHNPDIYLAQALEADNPGTQYIFVGDGAPGTSFNQNDWNPGDALRTQFMNGQVAANNYLIANFAEWDELGFIWNQGEGDADNSGSANSYQTDVTGLYDELKTQISLPGLNIFAVRLHANFDLPFLSTVRTAQLAAADQIIDGDSCELLPAPDDIHYSIPGIICLADKMKTALDATTPDTVTPPPPSPAGEIFATDFTGPDTATGVLDDWVQKALLDDFAFYRNNNRAVGKKKSFPRILRPVAEAAADSWVEYVIPSGGFGSQGTPRLLCWLRYQNDDQGYVCHVDFVGSRIRMGRQEDFERDVPSTEDNGDWNNAIVFWPTPYDTTLRYRIRFSVYGSSPTQLRGQIFNADTNEKIVEVTRTDTTAGLQGAAGVAGIGFYKVFGNVPESLAIRYDSFAWNTITDSAHPADPT